MNWIGYGMSLAEAVRHKSKDPSTKVGAVILDKDNRVVSTGFNGPPSRMDDSKVDWTRPAKYDYVLHAEENAILFAGRRLHGCTLYVTGHPCPHCALVTIQSGIRRVVASPLPIQMMCDERILMSQKLFRLSGVELVLVEES